MFSYSPACPFAGDNHNLCARAPYSQMGGRSASSDDILFFVEQRKSQLPPQMRIEIYDPDHVVTAGTADVVICGERSVLWIALIECKNLVADSGVADRVQELVADRTLDCRLAPLIWVGALSPFQKD